MWSLCDNSTDELGSKATFASSAGRHDKLVNAGRVGVFLGFSDDTARHVKVYFSERGYTLRSSRVRIDENTKGGTIELRLRGIKEQGTPNVILDRKPRGRPRINGISEAPSPPVVHAKKITKDAVEEDLGQDVAPTIEQLKTHLLLNSSQSYNSPYSAPPPQVMPVGQLPTIPQPLPVPVPFVLPPRQNLKRSRDIQDIGNDDHKSKVIRAMLAMMMDEADTENCAMVAIPQSLLHLESSFEKRLLDDFIASLARDTMVELPEGLAYSAKVKLGITIPRSYNEATTSSQKDKWAAVIKEEIRALVTNGTWKECLLPDGVNTISTKWVFDIKGNKLTGEIAIQGEACGSGTYTNL